MKIDVTHKPLALILQISPSGDLVESILSCEIVFEGGVSRRDVWLKEPSSEFRSEAQKLINEAVASVNA